MVRMLPPTPGRFNMAHGFCVAGGTDMALCSDLPVIEEQAKIGYPPPRV